MRKRDRCEMTSDLYCSLQAVNLSRKRRPSRRLKASSPESSLLISHLSQCSSSSPSCSQLLRSATPKPSRLIPPGVSSTVSVPLENSRLVHARGQAGAQQAVSRIPSTTASTTLAVRPTSRLAGNSTSRFALRRAQTLPAHLRSVAPQRPHRSHLLQRPRKPQ